VDSWDPQLADAAYQSITRLSLANDNRHVSGVFFWPQGPDAETIFWLLRPPRVASRKFRLRRESPDEGSLESGFMLRDRRALPTRAELLKRDYVTGFFGSDKDRP